MIVVAGGALPTEAQPGFGPDRHAEDNALIARALMSGAIPDSVINFAFYLLTADAGHPDHAAAWYQAIQNPRPVVEAFLRTIASNGARPTIDKPIRHYLLLPSGRSTSVLQEWNALADFTSAHRPAVGFSQAEAQLASRVTLAGDEAAIPRRIEEQLVAAGCTVDRLVPTATPQPKVGM
jgi:hypothetical protein